MRKPHWREWWGDPEIELGYIQDMVEGRDTTRPFIFCKNDRDIGYIQYWFVGHHQNGTWLAENPWRGDLPAETIGVDLSIGSASDLSMGLGTEALVAFVARLRDTGFSQIIIDPDPNNIRAVRAYEKAGFRPIAELAGKTGDSLIMRHVASSVSG